METITDPAVIRACDEPDERGDFPCCTTPAPVGAGLDLDAVPRLARLVLVDALDRAESAEAEVVTLRARLAAVEAAAHDWPCSDDTCDGDCTGCSYASDLRAALAVTTGEGE